MNTSKMRSFLVQLLFIFHVMCDNFTSINLPDEHMPFYFHNFPSIARKCKKDTNCPYKKGLKEDRCWGYENGCKWNKQYSLPSCPGDHKGWVQSKQAQQSTFYSQADFGYVRDQLREMKLLCEPLFPDDSSLECSEHLRFCRGRNIMINFTRLVHRDEPLRYKMDVLQHGDIGGYCDVKKDILMESADHISPLQSWGPEMRYFTRLYRRPIVEKDCDVVIEKPTFIMKIDATVNMYHHFCDFFNLYASLHVNASSWDAFSTDVHIFIWETYTYRSAFQDTWEAFTDHPLWDLKTFRGDVVCFKNVVFPLLPRMIYGLYYNTPIIYGCEKSGLFHAFSKHILHRLKIPFHKRENKKIRITWLSRDTPKRRILNEDAIIKKLKENEAYHVQKVVYNRHLSFKKQLEITRNSDVLVGIHGAGLTHLLFLPDWAAVFEAYNCEDPNCYMDLTRLRGLKYVTWEKPDKLTTIDDGSYTGGAPAKFVNYKFDIAEFVRLVDKAAKHVKHHSGFKALFEDSGQVLNTVNKSDQNVAKTPEEQNELLDQEQDLDDNRHKQDETVIFRDDAMDQDAQKKLRVASDEDLDDTKEKNDRNVISDEDSVNRINNNINIPPEPKLASEGLKVAHDVQISETTPDENSDRIDNTLNAQIKPQDSTNNKGKHDEL